MINSERLELASELRAVLSRRAIPGEAVRLAIGATTGEWSRLLDAGPVRVALYGRLSAVLVALKRGRAVEDAQMPDEPLALLEARLAGARVHVQREQLRVAALENKLAEREAGR